MLKINEIFFSIQGEGTNSGRPCIFIRTSGCPLRCTYCDTKYAYFEGEKKSIEEILRVVEDYPCKLVEVTGGEPMVQPAVSDLLYQLVSRGYETMIETCGSYSLASLPKETLKIVDFKTPASGEEEKNDFQILESLQPHDEVKFVICNESDFDWMEKTIETYDMTRFQLLVSPEYKGTGYEWLAERVLRSKHPLRMQLQIHKYIFDPEARGV